MERGAGTKPRWRRKTDKGSHGRQSAGAGRRHSTLGRRSCAENATRVCDVAGPASARAVVGIPGHRRGIQPNGRRQDLTVPHRQRRSVRGGSRLGGGCNPGTCSRYRDRSGDVSARPAVRDAHSARRHAPPPTLMTAAAVVVVLVCERVFEFVSVCGERVRPAGLGSRDLRAPRAAWPLNARPTRTRTRTSARPRPRARVPASIPRFAHRRKFSTGFSGWLLVGSGTGTGPLWCQGVGLLEKRRKRYSPARPRRGGTIRAGRRRAAVRGQPRRGAS